MSASGHRGRQKGVALVIGLIMLTMLTLMVLSSMMMSTTNIKVVGNMQHRDEAIAAANFAIEQVVSIDFMSAPAAGNLGLDFNRDGNDDYQVGWPTPSCRSWRVVPTSELDPDDPNDVPCFLSGSATGTGLGGTGSTNSFCADTLWEIVASVDDVATGARAVVRQGISRRMSAITASNFCD